MAQEAYAAAVTLEHGTMVITRIVELVDFCYHFKSWDEYALSPELSWNYISQNSFSYIV